MKLSISLGNLKIEYEGDEDFFISNIDALIASISSLPNYQVASERQLASSYINGEATSNSLSTLYSTSTSTFASSLQKAKGNELAGADLALCAAAKLTITDSTGVFSRKQLLSEMQNASAFYKKNMSSNLTAILKSLVKTGDLNENGTNSYSLSAYKRREFESLVSD